MITETQAGDDTNRKFIRDVFFVSSSVGWAVGYGGIIRRTTDGGETWDEQPSPTAAILTKIQFIDSNWGWILAEEGGEILWTKDSGRKWVSYHFPATGRVSSLSFSDKFNGWIVGEKGQVFQTINSGQTWQARGPELVAKMSGWKLNQSDFHSVRFFSARSGFVAGGQKYTPSGIIFKTMDGGRTWDSITATKSTGLGFVDFLSTKEAWGVLRDYRDERLLHSVDGGNSWTFVHATSKARTVYFVDPNNGWLVAGLWDYPATDTLMRTNDGGQSWSEVRVPKWTHKN